MPEGRFSQGRGGLGGFQTGPSPRGFTGDQLQYFDPAAMWDALMRMKKPEQREPPQVRSQPMQTAGAQQQGILAHNLGQNTPRQFATPTLSPQGQQGWNVNPLDIPAELQDVIMGGFYPSGTMGNFTYNVTPRQWKANPYPGGGGSMPSLPAPRPEEKKGESQQEMARRMYGPFPRAGQGSE